ncbi:MAG: argininosuccinate lyase, partial [Prolixibacteraceae bacterium]|nr:argininosuccinate lyase [Prolixibacteraceae bacterium]
DLFLASYDIVGSIAHIKMLETIGLLTKDELVLLEKELKNLYQKAVKGEIKIDEGVEDIHSQIEFLLTGKLGDIGKKIHSGRSRNDQVLLDLKLFTRDALKNVVENCHELIDTLIIKSRKFEKILMPGYTHLQVAMPSSFGLWFGAFAESLVDDLLLLQTAYKISNQNPLGSAAGYGSSFPLNRQLTTDLLGFDSLNYNVVYAQMGRGKTEKIVLFALANIASTISKLAFDVCLFMSQNFNFITLPAEFTTGSSIMPHKKNPDVFELVRARCNKLQGLPQQVSLITNNLPSGYFRDLQIVKEIYLPAFAELNDCLHVVSFALDKISVNDKILDDPVYESIFSVEEVNKLVMDGIPFRDAYRKVGEMIEKGDFIPEKSIHHTHEGSIGNLCLDKIAEKKNRILSGFNFEKVEKAMKKLTSS